MCEPKTNAVLNTELRYFLLPEVSVNSLDGVLELWNKDELPVRTLRIIMGSPSLAVGALTMRLTSIRRSTIKVSHFLNIKEVWCSWRGEENTDRVKLVQIPASVTSDRRQIGCLHFTHQPLREGGSSSSLQVWSLRSLGVAWGMICVPSLFSNPLHNVHIFSAVTTQSFRDNWCHLSDNNPLQACPGTITHSCKSGAESLIPCFWCKGTEWTSCSSKDTTGNSCRWGKKGASCVLYFFF